MGKRRNKSKKASNAQKQVVIPAAPLRREIEEKVDEKSPALLPAPSIASRLAAVKKQRFTEDFVNAIAVFMRTPKYRDMPVGELEWRLLPALLAGQCLVAFSKIDVASGSIIPSALVLWARVSDAADKLLDAGVMKLSPADWTSGENIWLIVTAGDKQGLAALVEKLQEKEFIGRRAKIRTQQTDGTFVVRSLPLSKPAVDKHKQERLDEFSRRASPAEA